MLDGARQNLRGYETVTELKDALNLTPVHRASIEAQAEPTAMIDVSRLVEALRVTARAVHVLAELGSTTVRDDSVAVMVGERALMANSGIGGSL